jgi:hypothetical protein
MARSFLLFPENSYFGADLFGLGGKFIGGQGRANCFPVGCRAPRQDARMTASTAPMCAFSRGHLTLSKGELTFLCALWGSISQYLSFKLILFD